MLSEPPDQLYLHSNVPALVAIFIRFRHESGYVGVEMPSGVPLEWFEFEFESLRGQFFFLRPRLVLELVWFKDIESVKALPAFI